MKKYFKIATVLVTGMFFLMGDGCGCTPPPSPTYGYLIDSPLEGVDYYCDEGNILSRTFSNGSFSCDDNGSTVIFKLGKLEIGKIEKLKYGMKIYPQDLVGVSQEDFTDERLVLLARLFQSLDDDGNITKSIKITQEVKDSFSISQFSDMTVADVEKSLLKINKTFVSEVDAIKHLKESMNRDRNSTK